MSKYHSVAVSRTLLSGVVSVFVAGLALSACSSSKKSTAAVDGGSKSDAGSTTKDSGMSKVDSGANVDSGAANSCDMTVKSETKCGSETCPAVTAIGAMFCTTNCCTSNKCGTRNVGTIMGMDVNTMCGLPPPKDTRCPTADFGGGFTAEPCCAAMNQCGIIFGSMCISREQVNMGGQGASLPTQACDAAASDGGSSDAN